MDLAHLLRKEREGNKKAPPVSELSHVLIIAFGSDGQRTDSDGNAISRNDDANLKVRKKGRKEGRKEGDINDVC